MINHVVDNVLLLLLQTTQHLHRAFLQGTVKLIGRRTCDQQVAG